MALEHVGYVDIYYSQLSGVRYRNDVLFGWLDLLGEFKLKVQLNQIFGIFC